MRSNFLCLFVFVCLIFGVSENANADYRQGYVVLSNGDTLHGKIDYKDNAFIGEFCWFILDGSDLPMKYLPNDINECLISDGKRFVSRNIEAERGIRGIQKRVFLDCMVKGKLSLYCYRDQVVDRFFIESDSLGFNEIPSEVAYGYNDNGTYSYVSNRHIGMLNYYMHNAPMMRADIEGLKHLGWDNLTMLVVKYNKIVCSDSGLIVYKKQLQLFGEDTTSIDYSAFGVDEKQFLLSNFKQGFVVLNSGDTLVGYIYYKGDEFMGKYCRFIRSGSDSIVQYLPNDIREYRFRNSKCYVSKSIDKVQGNGESKCQVFLEYLVKGRLNVYCHREAIVDRFFVESDSLGLKELPTETVLVYKDNSTYAYDSKRNIGILNYYMFDAPAMRKELEQVTLLDRENLIGLAVKYHNAVCSDGKCIVYKKMLPAIKVKLDFVGGSKQYSNHDVNNNSIVGGCLLHLWMPEVNERLYFQTGILCSKLVLEPNVDSDIASSSGVNLSIPFHLEFSSGNGIVQPRISYGQNLNLVRGFISPSVSFRCGLYLKLSNDFGFVAYSDFEFTSSMLLFPSALLGYSFMGGICYCL